MLFKNGTFSLFILLCLCPLGIDVAKIDVVIFIRPYDQLSAIVQGGGRGGRKLGNGMRRTVQVYQLFNSQDIGSANKRMSAAVKAVCLSKDCTRNHLMEYFVGGSDKNSEGVSSVKAGRCCHSCDKIDG